MLLQWDKRHSLSPWQCNACRCMASPLDSPRFFDDAGHSEWRLGGRVATGPRSVFSNAKAFAHLGPGAPQLRRQPRRVGDPEPGEVDQPASPRSYDSARDADDAIAIEIVRGAKGPRDNTWTVVVDGLRYALPPPRKKDPLQKSTGPIVFKLPGGVAHQKLTPTTRVRPVLVTVRLEEEARMPKRVEVAIDQVLTTSELALQRRPGSDEPPIQLGAAHVLTPYRVSDVVAPSLLLPYPFWAPAQSALGILSFEPVLRYQEQKGYATFYNAFVTWKNFQNAREFSMSSQVHSAIDLMGKIDGFTADDAFKTLKLVAPLFGVKAGELEGGDRVKKLNELRENYLGIPKPSRKAILQSKFAPKEPEPGTSESVVIGGGKVSAARELADMFRQLSLVCERRIEEANADKSGARLSLRQHLQRMRIALDLQGDHKLRSLFDALFTTKPYPPTKDFLERKRVEGDNYWAKQYRVEVNKSISIWDSLTGNYEYELDPEDYSTANLFARPTSDSEASIAQARVPARHARSLPEAVGAPADLVEQGYEVTFEPLKPIETLSPEERGKLEESIGADAGDRITKELERARQSEEEYMFTYDRLAVETRSKTTMRAQIRVSVQDYDGTLIEFVFESEKEDGIVAHAVYEQLPLDIAALDYYARDFVDCMFRAHRQADTDFKDAWTYVEESVRPWIFGKYTRKKPKTALQVKDMLEVYSFAVEWAVAPAKKTADGKGSAERSRFPFDEAQLEDRVAELRLMMREILPPWPPPASALAPNRRPVSRDVTYVVPADAAAPSAAEAPSAAPPSAAEAPSAAPPAPAPQKATLSSVFSKEQIQKYDLTEAETETQTELLFEAALKERIQRYDGAADTSIVVFTNDALVKRDARILQRRLPMIVKPKQLSVLFQMLPNMDPPTEDIPTDAETRRFGIVPVLAGSAVAGATVYYGVPMWLAFATMNAAIKNTQKRVKGEVEAIDAVSTSLQGFAPVEAAIALLQAGTQAWEGDAAGATNSVIQAAGSIGPALITFARTLSSGGNPALGSAAMVYEAALKQDLLPLTVNLASTIHTFMTARMDGRKVKREWYVRHRAVMRDKPVAAAINAANAAIKAYSTRNRFEAALFGSDYKEGAVYSRATGNRFLLVEYYAVDPQIDEAFSELHRLSNEGARPWAPVPNASAMRLMPPPEVGEAMYAAEELRGLPLTKIVEFTAGAAPALAATTPVALAAKAAMHELAVAVARQRRLLRGEHLAQSAGSLVAQLTGSAASILSAAYGKNAGFTSVFGDDPLWACARGGTAARLAVRHFGLFEAAEAARLSDSVALRERDVLVAAASALPGAPPSSRPVKSKLQAPVFWSQPRRDMMDQFVSALVAEAAEISRLVKGAAFPGPPLKSIMTDATRRAARIGALLNARVDLVQGERERILMLPASAAAHALLSNVSPGETLDTVVATFARELELSLDFADQRDLSAPRPPAPSKAHTAAAWASKRIATSISREQLVGDGAEVITNLLSGLSGVGSLPDIGEEPMALSLEPGPRTYYCPLGSRVVALPGRVPFDIDLFEQRLVWMDALQSAAAHMASVVVASATPPSQSSSLAVGVLVEATPARRFDEPMNDADAITGAARHPLAISVHGTVIRTSVASTVADATRRATGAGTKSSIASSLDLLHALGLFASGALDSNDVATRGALARRLAFGAERLLFALSFASTMQEASSLVTIRVPTALDAVSCGIAAAMLAIDLGAAFPKVSLEVGYDATFAQAMLEQLSRQAGSALGAGCKVCSLAEVVVSV